MNLILAEKYRYKNRNKIGIILISIVINTLHEGANAMGVTSISIYNESMAVIMLLCPSEGIYSTDLGEWGPILFACMARYMHLILAENAATKTGTKLVLY